jgi:crotonobetainyl-CoA:carnitine CoA-transferase CaiB-like acyl-CoA transferase
MPGPLEGLKVLEVANRVAGPSACAIMADMGAEVVKVEHPETPLAVWTLRHVGSYSIPAGPTCYLSCLIAGNRASR